MKNILAAGVAWLSLLAPNFSHAAVTLVDKDEWKILMNGFVEADAFSDSRRSLTEIEGNTPIDRLDTAAGSNGRTQFSARNSRFGFTILPPVQEDWKTKAQLEFDLFGYNPTPNGDATKGATNTETSFFNSPTLRLRHAYLSAENNNWQLLAGQTWSLFGWQPTYVITSVSVSPVPGVLFERVQQLNGMKTFFLGENHKLQSAVAFSRPAQRDSNMPNIDVGVKYSYLGLTSGFAAAANDVNAEPLSVAVSATARQFQVANDATGINGQNHFNATAFAVNAMIPILRAAEKNTSNSLTLTGEFTSGKGDADEFTGFTGNLSQLPSGTGSSNKSNLDAGQGGYDTNGSFQLIQLQSWNAQLQYHFPVEWRLFATAGYAQLSASSITGLTPVGTGKVIYDKSSIYFVNVFKDLTKQIRVAAEYGKLATHYVDGVTANDDRYQVSAWFRF